MMSTARPRVPGIWPLWLMVCLLLLAAALRMLIGRVPCEHGTVSLAMSIPGSDIARIRGTAAASAMIVGGSLGLSGLAFQVLLRNPLASPWVLGVSGGAGFGIMLGMWLGTLGGALGLVGGVLLAGGGVVGASAGALGALLIVQWLGRRLGGFDPISLVLAGIVVSATFAAGIMLLQHLVPHGLRDDLVGWMMGRIPWSLPMGVIVASAAGVALASVAGIVYASALDASCLGEEEARSVGVPIDRLRIVLLFLGGALAALAVVLAGPIAFVGLVAPHAARAMVGARHRLLVPGSMCAGATMLLLAETVRQWIDLGGGRLPIGVLTALVGGPAFLVLLMRRGRME
ncbi:MAG: iron ABC transporter permease [Phycisphaerales bacterium]|nr:iron ABC transporter permease [Phycisphaerales bacterium]